MKTANLLLTEPELEVLSGVLDAGVRAVGLKAVCPLAPVVVKMEALVFVDLDAPEDKESE